MDYTTPDNVRSHSAVFGVDGGTTVTDLQIAAYIGMVSRQIEQYTKRWFYAKAETRTYDMGAVIRAEKKHPIDPYVTGTTILARSLNAVAKLVLDAPLLTLTSLKIGANVIDVTKVVKYPRNHVSAKWLVVPLSTLYYTDEITVTGTWGWVDQPSDLVRGACDSWVVYLISAMNNPGISSKSIGGYSVGYTGLQDVIKTPPAHVKMMLDGLREIHIGSGGTPW